MHACISFFFSLQGEAAAQRATPRPLGIRPSIHVVNRAPWSAWRHHVQVRFVAAIHRCISQIRRRDHRWRSASADSAGPRWIHAPIPGKCTECEQEGALNAYLMTCESRK